MQTSLRYSVRLLRLGGGLASVLVPAESAGRPRVCVCVRARAGGTRTCRCPESAWEPASGPVGQGPWLLSATRAGGVGRIRMWVRGCDSAPGEARDTGVEASPWSRGRPICLLVSVGRGLPRKSRPPSRPVPSHSARRQPWTRWSLVPRPAAHGGTSERTVPRSPLQALLPGPCFRALTPARSDQAPSGRTASSTRRAAQPLEWVWQRRRGAAEGREARRGQASRRPVSGSGGEGVHLQPPPRPGLWAPRPREIFAG